MNLQTHIIITSLYLLLLVSTCITAQKESPKAPAPSPSSLSNGTSSGNITTLAITIPVFGGISIIIVIVVILFKRKLISSHGLILGFWMLMWFGSVVLNTWDIPRVSKTLVAFHIVVNVLGLVYWIRLGHMEYRRKNAWPSVNLLFEIGAWFSMFTLSCVEVFVLTLVGEPQYRRVSHWYPVAVAFISMVENYWTKGREIRANRMKSQLIKNLEEAFEEVIRLCMEDPKKVNLAEFDEKVNEFYRLLDMVVAQHREAIIVAQQREAMKKKQGGIVQVGDQMADNSCCNIQIIEGDSGKETCVALREGESEITIEDDREGGAIDKVELNINCEIQIGEMGVKAHEGARA
ncbi:unnamed protein product [Cuscuta epithymum]|uniref:Uncharacterized protein n=1 Tax=Cuscuta epithymum TaxID=186058 RepID=A0AAV0F4Z7_9ASTE|nr:unnamed protein product [Cuscuta epithymum]